MSDARRAYRRAELFDLVWSEPMIHIAQRLGISDVGLRKICTKADIPLPPSGYWMKIKNGKKVPQRPMLPRSSGNDVPITITSSNARMVDINADLPPDIISAVSALHASGLKMPRQVPIHALVAALAPGNEKRIAEVEARRRRFVSFLFAELEKRGGIAQRGERNEFKVTIAGEPVDITVRETYKMLGREPTADERRKAWTEGRSATNIPTGTLQLRIESWFQEPMRTQWRDGRKRTLEDQVSDVLVGLYVAAAFKRKRRLEREEEHRRRVLAEQKQEAEAQARRLEKERLDRLFKQVSDWENAARIRRFVQACIDAANNTDNKELSEWASWARDVADRFDPTVSV